MRGAIVLRPSCVFAVILASCLPVPAAPPVGVRVDSLGDPLPEGAIARFGTTRFWCSPPLEQVLFSPDGKLLIGVNLRQLPIEGGLGVGGNLGFTLNNGPLGFWEAGSGRILPARGQGHPTKTIAAIAPDGKLLYVDARPCCLLWDPATGKTKDLWDSTGQKVSHACYSTDGKTLAIDVQGGPVVLLDPDSGKERTRIELRGEDPFVQALAFSPDSRLLAITFQVGNVWIWDCVRAKRIRWFHTGAKKREDRSHSHAFAPDGRSLAVAVSIGGKHTIRHFEIESESETDSLAGMEADLPLVQLRYSPDGKKLYGVSEKGTLRRWETASGKLLEAFAKSDEDASPCAIDPSGQTLAVTRKGRIELIDVLTGKPRFPFRTYSALESATFADKSGDVIGSGDARGGFHFWNAATGLLHHSLEFPLRLPERSPRESVPVLSPDGKWIASWGDEFKSFRVVESREGKEVWKSPDYEECIGQLSFSPNGKYLAVHNPKGKSVEIWDVIARKRWRTIAVVSAPPQFLLTWSPDGRSLAAFTDDKDGVIWEVETGKVRQAFNPHLPMDLTFTRQGRHLAVLSANGRVEFLRIGTVETFHINFPDGELNSMTASPDGRWLAVGNNQGRVYLHELASGKQQALQGHIGAVGSLAFAPDSSRLVSASEDGTALVWDLKALAAKERRTPKAISLDECWDALVGSDAVKAARARAAFEDRLDEAVAFLEKKAEPARPVDPERLTRLLRDLDSDNFQTRPKTIRELEELGPPVESVLREAALKPVNLEMRKRLEALLQKFDGPLTHPETLRAVRVVEVLESLGTPAARSLLETLSKGESGARATREAKAALERLRSR